jgi:hypothetical protein
MVAALTAAMLCSIVAAQPEVPKAPVYENFSKGLARWWVEGGQDAWVQGSSLHLKADPEAGGKGEVATAWFRQELPADVRVAFDAEVVSSSRGANNINVFLHYSDPDGLPLYDTRAGRATAAYPLYHRLNGYIFTFVADRGETARPEEQRPARIRIRRCPGFELLAETSAYHNRAGQTYRVEIVKRGGKLTFKVDGNELLSAQDASPLEGGLLGFRTYRSYVRWSNLTISGVAH